MLDHGRGQKLLSLVPRLLSPHESLGTRLELLVMEALHIQMTPSEEHFVKTEDWIAGLQWSGMQEGRKNSCQPWISNDVYPSQCIAINGCLFTLLLITTEALSLKEKNLKSFLISSW